MKCCYPRLGGSYQYVIGPHTGYVSYLSAGLEGCLIGVWNFHIPIVHFICGHLGIQIFLHATSNALDVIACTISLLSSLSGPLLPCPEEVHLVSPANIKTFLFLKKIKFGRKAISIH
jgi:hypothetical protein